MILQALKNNYKIQATLLTFTLAVWLCVTYLC